MAAPKSTLENELPNARTDPWPAASQSRSPASIGSQSSAIPMDTRWTIYNASRGAGAKR